MVKYYKVETCFISFQSRKTKWLPPLLLPSQNLRNQVCGAQQKHVQQISSSSAAGCIPEYLIKKSI